jgi:hypothetical protein
MSISFSQFRMLCAEALDRTDLGSMTIRRERDPQSRRKTAAEIKRTKVVVDPDTGERKTVPVVQRTRSDSGKTREAGKSTAQIGAVDRTVSPQERAAKAAAAAKEERRKAAQARAAAKKSGGTTTTTTSKPSGAEAEKKATELLRKDAASKKSEAPSQPKRSYTKHDYGDQQLTSKEKTKIRSAKQNAEKRAAYNKAKEEAIKGFTETHGRSPKGVERTKLLAVVQKAHPPR